MPLMESGATWFPWLCPILFPIVFPMLFMLFFGKRIFGDCSRETGFC